MKVKVAQSCPTLYDPMDYTVQYSWASLVAQLVKNLPAMRETGVQTCALPILQETPVRFLGQEDPLEKE